MKVLRLVQARVLLWAKDRRGSFEVSKVVSRPLQPQCTSAPRCPGELQDSPQSGSVWVDPTEEPTGPCAYGFGLRGECLRHRNQRALELALFGPGEVQLTRRLLEALGYEVTLEPVDAVEATTVLMAHSAIGSGHEVRLLQSPVAGPIVLVRATDVKDTTMAGDTLQREEARPW